MCLLADIEPVICLGFLFLGGCALVLLALLTTGFSLGVSLGAVRAVWGGLFFLAFFAPLNDLSIALVTSLFDPGRVLAMLLAWHISSEPEKNSVRSIDRTTPY